MQGTHEVSSTRHEMPTEPHRPVPARRRRCKNQVGRYYGLWHVTHSLASASSHGPCEMMKACLYSEASAMALLLRSSELSFNS